MTQVKRLNLEAITKYLDNLPKPEPKVQFPQRYKIVDGQLVEDDYGDIIKYKDHKKALREKTVEVASSPDSSYSWRMDELPVDSSYDSNQSGREYSWRL